MAERRRVYVGIGSNIEPERHVRQAVELLDERFGPLVVSRVYRSAAVGFEGAPFLNLAVGFETAEPLEAVLAALRALEDACGRERCGPRYGPRTLDADLLLFGDEVLEAHGARVPRPEIAREPFVLAPLADIAAALRHPELGVTIAELWSRARPARPPEAVEVGLEGGAP